MPDEIKKQITDDITAGKSRTTFSQDGFPLDKLKESLPEDEKSNLTVTQKDVSFFFLGKILNNLAISGRMGVPGMYICLPRRKEAP